MRNYAQLQRPVHALVLNREQQKLSLSPPFAQLSTFRNERKAPTLVRAPFVGFLLAMACYLIHGSTASLVEFIYGLELVSTG